MSNAEFKKGDTIKLVCDVRSSKGNQIYAKRGENVQIISTDHMPVLIVAGKSETFPVRIESVTSINQP